MSEQTIAVKLNPRLESEGRGLCDPIEPENREVIAASNYGPQGYLRVLPSGFILAQISAGMLIQVNVGPRSREPVESKGTAAGRRGKSTRRAKGQQG